MSSWDSLLLDASIAVVLLIVTWLLFSRTQRRCEWWWQLSHLSLFAFVALAAVICAVLRSESWDCTARPKAEPNSEQAKAIAEIENVGGRVTVDESKQVIVYLFGIQKPDTGLEHVKALTNLQQLYLAENGFGKITDAGLENLKGLTELRSLEVNCIDVTDAGVEHLKGLTKLQFLELPKTQVTDAGLEYLEGLANLQHLDLSCTQVTDAGLVHLKGLTQLQTLNLSGCAQVTDAGLEHLKGLTQLQRLDLVIGRQVTDAGIRGLQNALPKCKIVH